MAIQGDLGQMLAGLPIMVKGCNIAITQPSIRDICALGEDLFLGCVEMFNHTDRVVEQIKMGNSQLARLSDFHVLIVVLQEEPRTRSEIDSVFELIFPNYVWEIAPGSINFRLEEHGQIVGQLNPMNYEGFQEAIRTLFLPSNREDNEDYNPANERAAEIARKLKAGKDKLAKMKEKDNPSPPSIFANYASILSVALGMDINVLYNYTPFQLFDAFIRYNYKMAYDLFQKVSTTPMMDTSKLEEPKHWMETIY